MSERNHLRAVRPRGVFHAVETRDGVGLARDGQTFYDANDLSSDNVDLWEIMFEDGLWILVSPGDLTWVGGAEGPTQS